VLDDLRLRIPGLLDYDVAVVPLDDLLRLEDLVAIEDREPPRILAEVLVFPTRELDELVAPQSAAFADEGQQTGRVLPISIPSFTFRKVASFIATRCLP
jgi:hypothetical protein